MQAAFYLRDVSCFAAFDANKCKYDDLAPGGKSCPEWMECEQM